MLTTAVFAICITAPLGAICINTLGPLWLSYDREEPKNEIVTQTDELTARTNADSPLEKTPVIVNDIELKSFEEDEVEQLSPRSKAA